MISLGVRITQTRFRIPALLVAQSSQKSYVKSVKREGLEVTGAGVITVNADMKVGNVSETVNVSVEAPVVDVQSTKRQAVLENKVINELPVARGYGSILAAVPTLQGAGASSSSS